ncbi:hypothetical protein GJ496_000827 [Pomphorhynchus laevis]|nr:hypothetical protein GJ496_000827 [Pomphorhynchus laevis]
MRIPTPSKVDYGGKLCTLCFQERSYCFIGLGIQAITIVALVWLIQLLDKRNVILEQKHCYYKSVYLRRKKFIQAAFKVGKIHRIHVPPPLCKDKGMVLYNAAAEHISVRNSLVDRISHLTSGMSSLDEYVEENTMFH